MHRGASSAASAPAPRPIRFVANHEGPYAKRRRINSACLTCRRKKTRCSGERPHCGTCTQNKHDCAGYGDDHGAADASRDIHKAVRRQSLQQTRQSLPRDDPPIDPRLIYSVQSFPPSSLASASHHTDPPLAQLSPKPEDEGRSTASAPSAVLRLSTRNRMPYFRYFGPTAIMPGLKQMVVKVRPKQHGSGQTTSDQHTVDASPTQASTTSPPIPEARTPMEIPLYDASAMAPSPLLTHLCQLFFLHLGCSFPFLQRDRFMRDLEEKQVDAILVDAVCALAARFSTDSMLMGHDAQPPDYGQAFAQRAKAAIPDAFPCPSVAVVQAALLLAYDEFGASRDSGLWMYLGISIRMAQDLGMQTLQGLRYEGRNGPTPNSIIPDSPGHTSHRESAPSASPQQTAQEQEQRAVERERLDTFWSIFFLDRVISSGTGRPVTLRDRDIEISFPSLDEVDPVSCWPSPYPALIRIIHLYGRVTDLLNRIRDATDITGDLQKQLGQLEDRLTLIYQNLSPKLHFNAVNFQQYVKINQGTNFLLLHCWFHTLIVLLHQPTLLKTLEGTPQSLSINSRELSMSSAKTVSDILAFTELIDVRSGLGNPFTSQPIYITACAFLKESVIHSASSQPHSRPPTPGRHGEGDSKQFVGNSIDRLNSINEHEQKQAAKHSLLASAANQNYQRCHRALKSLESYWAGVKYILTVLDQKAKGVGDPLLYTTEDVESALEVPEPEPSFTSPGWRRKLSWGTYLTTDNPEGEVAKMAAAIRKSSRTPIPGSPSVHPSQAIGWSLTGTMNSPSTNVAVMYTSEINDTRTAKPATQTSITSLLSEPPVKFEPNQPSPSTFSNFNPIAMPPPPSNSTLHSPSPASHILVSDADLLLNLHTPYTTESPRSSLHSTHPYAQTPSLPIPHNHNHNHTALSPPFTTLHTPTETPFGDMVIDTQDVDMSVLGADMMPWDLEYFPHDMLCFGDTAGISSNNTFGAGVFATRDGRVTEIGGGGDRGTE